jgi:hypothetical protein
MLMLPSGNAPLGKRDLRLNLDVRWLQNNHSVAEKRAISTSISRRPPLDWPSGRRIAQRSYDERPTVARVCRPCRPPGRRAVRRLMVDAHPLIASSAARPCFVSTSRPPASRSIRPLTTNTCRPGHPTHSHSVPLATQKSKMRSGVESSKWIASSRLVMLADKARCPAAEKVIGALPSFGLHALPPAAKAAPGAADCAMGRRIRGSRKSRADESFR